jgi:hypothetical protein
MENSIYIYWHVRIKEERRIRTSDLNFIRRGPNRLNYLLEMENSIFEFKELNLKYKCKKGETKRDYI